MISEETLKIPAFRRKKEIAQRGGAVKVSWPFPDTVRGQTHPPAPTASPIAIVTHYYDKIKVAVLKLTGPLRVGDRIQLIGKKGPFLQKITSMQIDRKNVGTADKGADIGIRIKKEALINEIASLVTRN